MPPPWQTYTIKHAAGGGNLHLIQKVFEGAFEVRYFTWPSGCG